MKDKLLQIRVDEDFLSKLEYLQTINGFRTIADTVRKITEKEYRKEKQIKHDSRWISVTERLPEKEVKYLCTVMDEDTSLKEMYYAPQEWRREDANKWKDMDGLYRQNSYVIAWMPLPEPYRS